VESSRQRRPRPGPALVALLLLAGCPDPPEPLASARFEPAVIDFGEIEAVDPGQPVETVVLRNTGDVALFLVSVEAVALPAAWSVRTVNGAPPTNRIEPGAGVDLEVRFEGLPSPGELGDVLLARLEVLSEVAEHDDLEVEVALQVRFDCDADADGVGAEVCGGLDCDDLDPGRYGGAIELCNGLDEDCDGQPSSDEVDTDGDGYLACAECDDEVSSTWPGAPELCNGVDDDCDPGTWADGAEDDADGDGSLSCDDCDDEADWNRPGGAEICDGLDNDCDGVHEPDEVDVDADSHLACAECDDGDPTTWPGAPELCDGVDNDCDGAPLPEEVDTDTDGFLACAECDDGDPTTWPGAPELCDGVDNDCDGEAPGELDDDLDGFLACEECDDLVATTWPGAPEECNGVDDDCDGSPLPDEVDVDGDGFLACAECDDGRADVFPGAEEACDGLDNDCDGAPMADEVDGDGDGFLACADCDDGEALVFPGAAEACNAVDDDCDGSPLPDEVDGDGDGFLACEECDDLVATTWPGAPELCNGVDDDCDGSPLSDEVDADGDGFLACEECDDGEELRWPGAPELCDGLDNDCDGAPLPEEVDIDGDGFLACEDCDDGDSAIHPDAADICDGLDNDCDGVTDDLDGDGWDCTTDCDDSNPDVWTPSDEVCNGIDDDCDGEEDEEALRVPEDFGDVQSALDARTGPGEVVCVGPGTWPGELVIYDDGVELIGRAGSASTFLSGGSTTEPALEIWTPGDVVTVEGFTITDPYSAAWIYETTASFADIVVRDLTPGPAGTFGIEVHDSEAEFTDIELLDNELDGPPSNDLVRIDNSSVVVQGLSISGNLGAGVLLNDPNAGPWMTELSVTDCLATDNVPDNLTDGLFMGNGQYVFERCTFAGNDGSAIFVSGDLTVSDSVFEDIAAYAISGNGGEALVEYVRVIDCGVDLTWQQDLSPVTLWTGGDFVVRNSILAGSPTGGLTIGGRTGVVENVSIIGNSVNAGLHVQQATVTVTGANITGGDLGVKVNPATTNLTIEYSNVWDNTIDWWNYPNPTGTDGNISIDPQHLDTSSADPADWDLHLITNSFLVDAGDPARLDPDGSPSDIGAWGGPDAGLWDLDGDGYPSWWQPGPYNWAYPAQGWDCDDLDPDVIPGDGC